MNYIDNILDVFSNLSNLSNLNDISDISDISDFEEIHQIELNQRVINSVYSLRRTIELRVNNEYIINNINFEEFINDFENETEYEDIKITLSESEFSKLNSVILDESILINKDCSICLDKLLLSNNLIILKCNHIYHKDCIKSWFNQSTKCPICRCEIRNN